MNRVVVFGGTGSIGKLVVEKLVQKGFRVKAFTRSRVAASAHSPVEYFQGNVLDFVSVESCISEADAVVIALGFNDSDQDTMSKGTRNIINAMKNRSATRLLCLSAQGAGDSWNQMPDSFKEMVVRDEILSASFKDHGLQEELVRESGLNWTIVRPTEVVEDPLPGKIPVVNEYRGDLAFQISRHEVAEFLVSELVDGLHIQGVVLITC